MKKSVVHLLFSSTWALIVTSLVTILVICAGFSFFFSGRAFDEKQIVQDLQQLQSIFKKIDQECGIAHFDHTITPINFLNVGSFAGSEVGSMNLAHPTKWQGPYSRVNPKIQNYEYQIVTTKKGLYITPGNGVRLPNKKVVGKDIILDENSDIDALLKDPQALVYRASQLAVKLELPSSAVQRILLENLVNDEDADLMSNYARPVGVRFACNDQYCSVNG